MPEARTSWPRALGCQSTTELVSDRQSLFPHHGLMSVTRKPFSTPTLDTWENSSSMKRAPAPDSSFSR